MKNRNSVSFYGLRLVPFWVCERGTYTMNMGTVKKLYLQRKFATLNGYGASIWIFSLSNLHLWNGIFNRILQFSFVIPTSFGVLHQKIVIIGCNFVGIAVKWRVCIAIFAYGHNIRYFIRYRSIDGGNGDFTITLAQCKQIEDFMVLHSLGWIHVDSVLFFKIIIKYHFVFLRPLNQITKMRFKKTIEHRLQ